ncbi:hypothetical protein [Brenneria corticis]|uniref:hypothetical protein n=1 Tax=Brenneria corticis TaxID=2173106 RepID=UPI00109E2779|nr:hypothetical protein [Brenneria sp. CFCC 11842]
MTTKPYRYLANWRERQKAKRQAEKLSFAIFNILRDLTQSHSDRPLETLTGGDRGGRPVTYADLADLGLHSLRQKETPPNDQKH